MGREKKFNDDVTKKHFVCATFDNLLAPFSAPAAVLFASMVKRNLRMKSEELDELEKESEETEEGGGPTTEGIVALRPRVHLERKQHTGEERLSTVRRVSRLISRFLLLTWTHAFTVLRSQATENHAIWPIFFCVCPNLVGLTPVMTR